MANLTLSTPRGRNLSIQNSVKFSSCRSLSPTSLLFNKRNAYLLTTQYANGAKNVSFQVKSQYSAPDGQQRHYQQQNFSSFDSASQYQPQPGQFPPKVYVGYSIYKGKAALTVEPRPPEFVPLDSGAFRISKEGYVFLQFAPASGTRQYDWSRKQIFTLSVNEIGHLISLGPRDSCEFFHDPSIGKSDEGKIRKMLKVEPLPDGSGHFFSLSVQNKLTNVDESIYIPVTKAELAVLVSTFKYILPYLLGWHTFANSIRPDGESRASTRSNPEYEWSM